MSHLEQNFETADKPVEFIHKTSVPRPKKSLKDFLIIVPLIVFLGLLAVVVILSKGNSAVTVNRTNPNEISPSPAPAQLPETELAKSLDTLKNLNLLQPDLAPPPIDLKVQF